MSTEQIYTPYPRDVKRNSAHGSNPVLWALIGRQITCRAGYSLSTITAIYPEDLAAVETIIARYTYNKDVDLKQHTYRRLELEAQQYIPLFNQRRVIALRARSELTYKNRNQSLPFYMQPTLGGSNDLRGFRPFRFYDDNLIVFNAEYGTRSSQAWIWRSLETPERCFTARRTGMFTTSKRRTESE